MQQTPSSGFARISFVTGRKSRWRPVNEIEEAGPWVLMARDDDAKTCAMKVAALYIAFIEYATEAEKIAVEKADKEAAEKAAKGVES